MKKLTIALVLCFIASSALGAIIDKDGADVQIKTAIAQASESSRDDWVYNTGGVEGFVPTVQGSASGWGEWFITTVMNDTGEDLYLSELGFPCSGPATEPFGWLVWVGINGMNAPAGNAYTADFYGEFAPVEPNPEVDPLVYTFIDISEEFIVVPNGAYFSFGYDNTGLGGQTDFNGVDTWAWYGEAWDPDVNWGRTAILQVKGNFEGPVATESVSLGEIRALYR